MLLLLSCACGLPAAAPTVEPPPPVAEPMPAAPPPPTWPASSAGLTLLSEPAAGPHILLDPGHGAPKNAGNTSVRCEQEQVVMLRLAQRLEAPLKERELKVQLSRQDHTVSYDVRLKKSASFDAMISLHSDARAGLGWMPGPQGCWQTVGAAGMAILYSDEGETSLVEARLSLARAVALRMASVGFLMYSGSDYSGLYDPDQVAGVFVDRHIPAQRIRLLRRPVVPSIIIETHDSHDVEEAARWEEEATVQAFAGALAAGIADWRAPQK
ncbi:MAG TPA: N-acetylmuramoyl-L-alanine amidase [Myxococcota bacterium]|nr:N-acetylmuramoyl-L-alanine amidase [Myxococcota bacterium]HNH45634.1 N-acetylmuramoyl-L-alanine amidase [Myxococcota bacterium]